MLTPEYLDQITDDILGMYDALNESVIEDIARRIVKTGRVTETAAWQAKQAQEMGALYEDVIRRVSEISGLTEQELQRLFEDAAVENIRYENDIMSQMGLMPIELKQSEAMLKLLRAGLDKTGKDLSNLTLTTAIRAQNAYYNASNLAYLQVSSGVLSHQEAVKKAILSTAKEGVTVLYPTGHIDKIDVAIRRAVLTGVNQTAAKMSLEYCDETGCDFVETTAHSGARPSHAVWQGRVFCRSGMSREYPPFSETGYGTGPGLCGWNCRHNFHAFWPGISVPAYSQEMLDDYNAKKFEYNGEKLTDYECSQMQRAQERKIRETRRQLTACDAAMKATDDADLRDKLRIEFEGQSVRLKQQEAELRNFCEKTKRAVDSARLQVHAVKDTDGRIIGFNKSVSQKVVDNVIGNDKLILSKSAFLKSDFEDIKALKFSLSDLDTRLWYKSHDEDIPNVIDRTSSIVDRARQACELRNMYRTQARDLMKNQASRRELDEKYPNKTFEELIESKMRRKGMSFDEAAEDILHTATKTNKTVNKALGLE